MKNLAGVDTCDVTIKEELFLAGIEAIKIKSEGEVPYSFQGKIGHWKLSRAWTYWIASVERPEDGLILADALELHNMESPTNPDTVMGNVIRSGGHCGCPSPDEYGASPIYDEMFHDRLKKLGYKERYFKPLDKNFVDISVREIRELFEEGKLDVERYVNSYHIDSQLGLNVFANFIKNKKK